LLCMRLEVCFHPDLVPNRKHLFNKQNIGMKLKRTFCLLFEQEPSHCIFFNILKFDLHMIAVLLKQL